MSNRYTLITEKQQQQQQTPTDTFPEHIIYYLAFSLVISSLSSSSSKFVCYAYK
jgi:hypothetical protein